MRDAIGRSAAAQPELGKDIWFPDVKPTDDALAPIFQSYFKQIKQGILFL